MSWTSREINPILKRKNINLQVEYKFEISKLKVLNSQPKVILQKYDTLQTAYKHKYTKLDKNS